MKFPFLFITPVFIIGIILQKFISIPFLIFPAIFLFIVILAFLWYRKNKGIKTPYYITSCFLILILFCGYFVSQYRSERLSFFPDWFIKESECKYYGKVSDIGLMNKNGFTFQFDVDSISFKSSIWHRKGTVLVKIKPETASLYNKISPGDYLLLSGLFYKGKGIRNPGDFDYDHYLRLQGISGIISIYNSSDIRWVHHSGNSFRKILLNIRQSIFNKLIILHDAETAALLKGLLLADRSDVDEETKTDFINSGVMHVLAVSGLHMAFILVVFVFLFGRFNLWMRSILISLGVIFYILITGDTASAVRAGIMYLVLLISFMTNRDSSLLNGLAVSAFIILLFNPDQLYMAGFQLSYLAVLSIALIYPSLSKTDFISSIKNKRIKDAFLFLILSLSCQIGTLPFIILYFGKISLTSLAANIFVIPLSGLILGNGIFTVILSYLYLPVAHYAAATSGLLVKLMYLVTFYSGGELSFLPVKNFNILNLVCFYIFLGIFLFYFQRFSTLKGRSALILLVTLNIILYSSLGHKKLFRDHNLNIFTLDVGQGDSFLIKFPDNTTALIDAGESSLGFDNGLRTVLPVMNYLGIEKIDYAFISHLDKDHFSGMISLLNAGVIRKVYKPKASISDTLNRRLEIFLKKRCISFNNYRKEALSIRNSRVYILNDNIFLNDNDNSGLLKIVYGNTSFLFTGDISTAAERYYLSRYNTFLGSTVLKVSHHGSKTASSMKFISEVHPQISIISAGYKNKFHHPAPETINNLLRNNSTLFRTDHSGAILLSSDGRNVSYLNWKD